jgi:proteasome assembly chaperone (PAC2) family protein
MADLHYLDRPGLRNPTLIMAFSGWPNAGEIASGTAAYLKKRLGAGPLAVIEADPFFDFTDNRPTAVINNGYVQEINRGNFYFYHLPTATGEPDLIMLSSPEPQLQWNYFADLVFQMVEDLGVRTIFTLGGTYDYVPHWLLPTVSTVFSNRQARDLLPAENRLNPADYQGPVSIHTAILVKGREVGLPVIGLWGHTPVYIQNGFVKMHQRLLEILTGTIGFTLDTSELLDEIADMDRQVEEAVDKNPGLRKYLDQLKEEYQSPAREKKPTHPKPTGFGRGKVISLEEFLNKNGD